MDRNLSQEWERSGVFGQKVPKIECSGDRAAPGSLQEPEEDFFTVIAEGNMSALRQFMKKHRNPDGSLDFDVNCSNFHNETAMSVAVDKSNLDMIKYLAQVMTVTKNSVLLKAIHRGDLDLVKGLCESMSADEEALESNYKAPTGETDYPDFVTPLMVAATEGHYEIVGYLIDRGHRIVEPHPPGCLCVEACQAVAAVSDRLHLLSLQFQTYAALSNPAHIPYATADPIHYCFQLHRRLNLMSGVDPAFRTRYAALADQVGRFAARLVSECRSSKEVELILKQPHTHQKGTLRCEYPRLLMAFDFNQKQFITEPKIQIFTQNKFYGAFDDWVYYNEYQKLKLIFVRIVTVPIAFLSFLANPKSDKSRYFAAPVNKMLHFLAAHLVFLGLLFLETWEPKPVEHRYEMNSAWSYVIFLYFFGFAGLLAYQIVAIGLRSFLRQPWNVYDLLMATVFSLFVAFSVSSWVHVRMPQVISTERKFWSRYDPQLLAEGCRVVATILAYLKILFFLEINGIFGPLLVSSYQLIRYLLFFCFFGAAVLLGYSVAFSHFYSYYSGMSYVDPDTRTKSTQEESFTDALSSLKIFFWGIFGLSSSSAADVVLDTDNDHVFTELVGYAGLGSFLLLMILVLKSALIASSAKTLRKRTEHEDWLFQRTRLFLYFIDLPLLPPPLNLLPHRYVFTDHPKHDLEMAKADLDPEEEYKELAKALVERYFNAEHKIQEKAGKNRGEDKCDDPSKNCQRIRCRSL